MLTLDERKLIDSYCMMNEPINIVENITKAMKNVKIKGKSVNVEPANAR